MKRLIVFAAALLALVATTAAPAGAEASHGTGAEYCGTESEFSSLGRLASTAPTARDFNRDAPRRIVIGDSEYDSGLAPNVPAGFKTTVSTYVHVITDGKIGAVKDSQIREQIQILNMSYAGFWGGAETGFRFELKGITRTNNAAWHSMVEFGDELAAKQALRRGGPDALNLYINNAAGALGFAYYPSILKYNGGKYAVLDGAVVYWGSLPRGPEENFNLGYTATHEVGHWLGLAHTFELGCYGDGDRVDDTPAQAVPTSGCPEGKDTCKKEAGLDPIHNYMDYSYDSCYTEFTKGQASRMQAQFVHFRTGRY
jgi:Pregnancy-associated plasma protein-A